MMKIAILSPVFNDWLSARSLIANLSAAYEESSATLEITLVDDGSTEEPPLDFAAEKYSNVEVVEILRLRRNLGHQRAIAVGLCHLFDKSQCDVVVVMDSDGEDKPCDAARLTEKVVASGGGSIIFAERGRRSENALFKAFYRAYCLVHWLLTGQRIRVGNFSVVPKRLISRLVTDPNLWNHYAAAVYNSRIPHFTLKSDRGSRYHGKSKLNFAGLVIHGLSAIACYSEIIGVRVMVLSLLATLGAVAAIGTVIVVRFTTSLAIPGWATMAVGFVLILFMQILSIAALFTFTVLHGRRAQSTIPIKEYSYFIQ